MVDAVGEHGYAKTTVAELIVRAGVSRKAFYQHFPNKLECLLETHDALASELVTRVAVAYGEAGELTDSARAGISALFEWAIENPRALRLVLMEVGAAGPAGTARREQLLADFQELLRASLGLAPGPNPVLRAIVGGLNKVLLARVQSGEYGDLLELVPELVRWATSYTPPPPAMIRLQKHPPTTPRAPTSLLGGRAPGSLFPHIRMSERRGLARGGANMSHSLVVHSQRERILDAVANLTAARGYGGVTCEAIAEEAAVSLQAFYTHFTGKEDAFLVAYEIGHHKSLAIVERAHDAQPDWRNGVRAGISALFEFLASEPSFAHIALVDGRTATHRAAERCAEGALAYTRLLGRGLQEPAAASRPSPVTIEAISGGLQELCFGYVLRERVGSLPDILPAATYFALAPFVGVEDAARVATTPQQG